jgi:hypothetical protein
VDRAGCSGPLASTMTIMLYIAAFLAFAVGIAHSVLGEGYVLTPLFRHTELPKLFGSPRSMIQVLRFAWHLTTIAWCGFAAILILLATRSVSPHNVLMVLGVTFTLTGAVTFAVSRGRHLAWPVFLVIGGVCLYGSI